MLTDGHVGTLSFGETVEHSNVCVYLNDLSSLQTAESQGSQDMFFQELPDNDQVMVKGNAPTLVLVNSRLVFCPANVLFWFCHIHTYV